MEERPIIVVVGMHRSGTSLVSHILSLMGVDMADEPGPYPGNPYGHFERWDIVAFHDQILEQLGRVYYSPFHDFPLPAGWKSRSEIWPARERLKASIKAVMARSDMFGFKDPRTTRLIPMWADIFAELGLRPRFVICLRDPAHIAASLHSRDGLDPEIGELRALDYLVDALRHTRGRDRFFIQYDDWMSDPLSNAARLQRFVNPVSGLEPCDMEASVMAAVRPEENHAGRGRAKARYPLVQNFFDLVSRFAASEGADPALDAQIVSFTNNYLAFRETLRPVEAQFREMALAKARLEEELSQTQRRDEAIAGGQQVAAGEDPDNSAAAAQAPEGLTFPSPPQEDSVTENQIDDEQQGDDAPVAVCGVPA